MTTAPLAPGGHDVEFVRYDEVPLSEVRPSPHQPRKHLDPLVIQSLKESILAVGVMQRPRVRELSDGFELVFGHQRAEACRELGWNALPVEVVQCDDLTARRMTLHENIKSTRLHPIEHAEGICNFLDATLASEDAYGLIPGDTPTARIHRVLSILVKPPAEGEENIPARQFVLGKQALIEQVIREMANKEPKGFLSADVSLFQLPEEVIQTTVERGLKKGHAKVLGELLARQPEMYQEVLSRGVRSTGEEDDYTPLERAAVGTIRNLYKPKKVEPDPQESAAYQTYVPIGVPESAPAEEEIAPWEDDEAVVPMFALPLASLKDAHDALTTLSASEWSSMIKESGEGARADAKRQWAGIRRWAEEVLRDLD